MSLILANCAPSQQTESSSETSVSGKEATESVGLKTAAVKPDEPRKPQPPKPQPPKVDYQAIYNACVKAQAEKNPAVAETIQICSAEARKAQSDYLAGLGLGNLDKKTASKERLAELYAAQKASISVYNTAWKACKVRRGVSERQVIRFYDKVGTCIDRELK